MHRLLREALEWIVLRNDRNGPIVRSNIENAQQEAHILLVMKLGPDPHRQALHRK